jgi:hypothetical protein
MRLSYPVWFRLGRVRVNSPDARARARARQTAAFGFGSEAGKREHLDVGMVNTQSGSALTDLEFALRTASALVSTLPDKATNLVADALARTVDPRLRHLLRPTLAALAPNDVTAARSWLDRACEYERARRESAKRQKA